MDGIGIVAIITFRDNVLRLRQGRQEIDDDVASNAAIIKREFTISQYVINLSIRKS